MQRYQSFINQLKKGDVIQNDIYFNKTLLSKAGTKINDALLEKLQNWGTIDSNHLNIRNYVTSSRTLDKTYPTNKQGQSTYSKSLFDIKELFYESLQYVVSETRYGLILNSDGQLAWLENLFISALSDSRILNNLFVLKENDPYSYFHSFDVFLLGSLLAQKSGIHDIHSFATGCLIHDIGKLKLSKKLLQKDGTLSKIEFEEIQKHTSYGIDFIKENDLPLTYVDLIKSHHERLDGTGYPEGLTGDSLSEEVRLLAIIDTYSALTLQRSYRDPFSSKKAMELLLNKKNKYDLTYVISLIELIGIYPTGCIVKLSNGKSAKVKSVNVNHPYLPLLEEIDTSNMYELPLNFSVTILGLIEWNPHSDLTADDLNDKKEIYWNYFFEQLIDGNIEEAMTYYQIVTEGMTMNTIFIDVIIRSIKEVETKRIEGKLAIGEQHDVFLKIKDILAVSLK